MRSPFGLNRCLRALPLALVPLLAVSSAAAFDSDADAVSDEADAFPCNANSSAVLFAPAQGQHGLVLFEDQWPEASDLDFNDAAISYNYIFEMTPDGRVRSLRATFNVLAVGGIFNNGLGLQLPVLATAASSIRQTIGSGASSALSAEGADSNLTLRLLPNLRSVFGNQAGVINSDPSRPITASVPVSLEITFSTPQSIDLGQAPFDLFIFRSEGTSHEVHRPQYPGTAVMNQGLFHQGIDGSTSQRHFVDTTGLPFALTLPELRPWPQEGVRIDRLYPNIAQFAASGGQQAQDFYNTGVDMDYAFGWDSTSNPSPGQPAPAASLRPQFIGSDDIPADTGCVNAWGLSVTYGTSRDTFAYDSAVDAAGNLIIVGYTNRALSGNSNLGSQDIFVAKYQRPSGTLIWSKQLGGTGAEAARSVAINPTDNSIYIAGETRSSFNAQTNSGQTDAFLLKLDASGNTLWTRLLGASGYDYASGVGVDSTGAVFIAGGTTSRPLPGATAPQGTGPSSFLAKYDSAGSRLWTTQYRTDSSDSGNYSYASDIAIDPSNNVLVVGSERRYNRDGSAADNVYVAKQSGTAGAVTWVNHLGDYGYYKGVSDYRFAHGLAIAADPQGAALVTGTWEGSVASWNGWSRTAGDRSSDVLVTKVDGQGNALWNRSFGSTNGATDYGLGVQTDSAGNVFLTGYTAGTLSGQSSRGSYDYFASRFDANGNPVWTAQDGTSTDDGGFGVSVDTSRGVLWVVGNTGNLLGTPIAFRDSYYGFMAQHQLTTGARTAFTPTVDTRILLSSCKAILDGGASTGNGTYTIDPDGAQGPLGPFDVYCDMTTDGGGWTLFSNIVSGGFSYNAQATNNYGTALTGGNALGSKPSNTTGRVLVVGQNNGFRFDVKESAPSAAQPSIAGTSWGSLTLNTIISQQNTSLSFGRYPLWYQFSQYGYGNSPMVILYGGWGSTISGYTYNYSTSCHPESGDRNEGLIAVFVQGVHNLGWSYQVKNSMEMAEHDGCWNRYTSRYASLVQAYYR